MGADLAVAVARQAAGLAPDCGAVRVGVDLVEVEPFQRRFDGRAALLEATFGADELAYCRGRRDAWPHLAARFAAKEALLKALGTGLAGRMSWRDVEVARDTAGAPSLRVTGAVAEYAMGEGVRGHAVSLSHTRTHAMAVVVLTAG